MDRHVFSRDYAGAFRNVMSSVLNPGRTFRFYGVDRAIRNEWLPLTLRNNDGGGAWIANYAFHTFGDGFDSVLLEEWYAAHGVPHPRAAAIASEMTEFLLNEVVENSGTRVPNEDATTDLLIFDPMGLVLWRFKFMQDFFSGPLELTNWAGQPSIDLDNNTLQNASHQLVIRWSIPGTRNWRGLYAIGLSNLLGLSYGRRGGGAWSAAIGPYVKDNPVVDSLRDVRSATFGLNAGVFYDRDGSLLMSALYQRTSDLVRLNVNLYPGTLRVGGIRPGLWLQTVPRGGVRIGVASRWGFGLASGRDR